MENLERSRLTPNAKFRPNRRGAGPCGRLRRFRFAQPNLIASRQAHSNAAIWNCRFQIAATPQLDSVEGLPLTVGSVAAETDEMADGTMAGVADGRGVGHARQSQYSTTAKSGANSQKPLLNSVRVPIPISKVRYHKDTCGGVTMKSNRPSMEARRGYYETVPGLLCSWQGLSKD